VKIQFSCRWLVTNGRTDWRMWSRRKALFDP